MVSREIKDPTSGSSYLDLVFIIPSSGFEDADSMKTRQEIAKGEGMYRDLLSLLSFAAETQAFEALPLSSSEKETLGLSPLEDKTEIKQQIKKRGKETGLRFTEEGKPIVPSHLSASRMCELIKETLKQQMEILSLSPADPLLGIQVLKETLIQKYIWLQWEEVGGPLGAACLPRGGPQVDWGPFSSMGALLERLEASWELLNAEKMEEGTKKKLLSVHRKQTEIVKSHLETKAKSEIRDLLQKISHLRAEGISGVEEPQVKEIQQQVVELEALEKGSHIPDSSLKPLRFALSRLIEGVNSEAVEIGPLEEETDQDILGGPKGGSQRPPGSPPQIQGLGVLAEEEKEEEVKMLEEDWD